MSLRVQEDVFRLQVPVDNVQGVQVAQSAGDFSSVEAGTGFEKAPFSLKVIEKLQKEREGKKRERVRERMIKSLDLHPVSHI